MIYKSSKVQVKRATFFLAISFAIRSSALGAITLHEIYEHVCLYSAEMTLSPSWKNSIRQKLSSDERFYRIPVGYSQGLWAIRRHKAIVLKMAIPFLLNPTNRIHSHPHQAKMEFTDLYKQTNQSTKPSPNSAYIASIVLHRIIIRDAESLQIVTIFTGLETFASLQWSPDSNLIAANYNKLDTIQIYKVSQIEWESKITLGTLGVSTYSWSPDSRHIIVITNHNIRFMVWSLVDGSVIEIMSPKMFIYRRDMLYLALTTRKDGKEWCAIYDTRNWKQVTGFVVETVECVKMEWSPDARYIAFCDHALSYNVCVYTPDGRLSGRIEKKDQLGCKTMKWSPSSQFLALGDYNQNVILYNHLTWNATITIKHPEKLVDNDISVFMETENVANENDTLAVKWNKASSTEKLYYQKTHPPITIGTIRPDYEKMNPKVGVGLLEFSADGKYLLTRNDNMGHCLWIFDMQTLHQKALIHQCTPHHFIKQVKWNPIYIDQFVFLAHAYEEPERFTEKTSYLYYYRNDALEIVQVPAVNFQVAHVEWNSDGRSLILMDSEKFCIAFPLEESTSDAGDRV